MGNIGNHFRTVSIGGFHKQDVLDYITAASREHQEKLAALTTQDTQLKKELGEMAERLAAVEAERDRIAAEALRLTAELNQRIQAVTAAERELAELREEHASATARLAELEERLPDAESGAAAYAQLKDRTATIEMEARRKAQQIVAEAEERSAQLHARTDSWVTRVQHSYRQLHTDVAATMTRLSADLEQGKAILEEKTDAFQQYEEELNELTRIEKQPVSISFPDPLPLDEEPEEGAVEADG